MLLTAPKSKIWNSKPFRGALKSPAELHYKFECRLKRGWHERNIAIFRDSFNFGPKEDHHCWIQQELWLSNFSAGEHYVKTLRIMEVVLGLGGTGVRKRDRREGEPPPPEQEQAQAQAQVRTSTSTRTRTRRRRRRRTRTTTATRRRRKKDKQVLQQRPRQR